MIIHGRKILLALSSLRGCFIMNLIHSSLQFFPNAGHLAEEPDMIEALVSATDEFIDLFD